MTDEWTRAEKIKAQSEQAKAIMDFVSMLSDKINELEKENAELIKENEEMKKGLGCETCQIHLEYMRLNDKIRELEKENAELKRRLDNLFNSDCLASEKLTKAKEHIRTLISCLIDWVQEGDKDYCHIADAEQFLKATSE